MSRVVVALGGNALLRRGEVMSTDNQRAAVAVACSHLAPLASCDELVVSHGNGPQIGLLALEEAAYAEAPDAPLDVLGAETQGMIGYLIEQELRNALPLDRRIATLLTMVEVDATDPAFGTPSKPIGPWYSAEQAASLEAERGWTFREERGAVRRVVPSPTPRRIVERDAIHSLLASGAIVICAGGGGIPVAARSERLAGVEAVIDKDLASSLLARDIAADVLVMATDATGVFVGFGGPNQRMILAAHPDALLGRYRGEFAAGSMLPKVLAACEFSSETGNPAVIGALADIDQLVQGARGTTVSTSVDGVVLDQATAA